MKTFDVFAPKPHTFKIIGTIGIKVVKPSDELNKYQQPDQQALPAFLRHQAS
jgi:hypothetical protein